MLCELARTDSHRFRVLEPDSRSDQGAAGADPRARGSRRHARSALTNQLRAELERFWPGPIGLFTRSRQPDLARVPGALPEPGRRARAGRAAPCRRSWRASATPAARSPRELLAKLRRAPEGRVGEAELAARRRSCSRWSRRSSRWSSRSSSSSAQIATALREHPDGEIFLSLFRDPRSVVTAAELLAEIGDCRARYPTRDALAADAGQAAVAIESGKRKTACFRWGCNKRLRGAFCTLADSTRHWHPWAQTATPPPAPAATTTPARYAPSAAPGAASSGAAGKTAPRTTPPATAPCNSTCTVTIPTPSGPVPDLAATQRMARRRRHRRAARRAEREALDGKPTSAIALGG